MDSYTHCGTSKMYQIAPSREVRKVWVYDDYLIPTSSSAFSKLSIHGVASRDEPAW
jgi:hypothetical protein